LYNRFKKDYPDAYLEAESLLEYNIVPIKIAHQKIQKLDSKTLAPDVFLLKKAMILDTMVRKSDWFIIDGIFPNRRLATDLYTKLYTNYPESDLADDAEFAVKGNCLLPNDNLPSKIDSTCVRYWEHWLEEHSSASIRPNVYQHLAVVYGLIVINLEENQKLNKKSAIGTLAAIEKSKYYSDKIKEEYPNFWKKDMYLQKLIQDLDKKRVK
jgi:hypothetical protein